MSSINIPPAALEAGCSAYTAAIYKGNGTHAEFREAIRAAFEAMVEAWPGMAHYRGGWEPVIHNNRKPHLILPLTENGNG